jgi:presenilin-like A22 family membrane protease
MIIDVLLPSVLFLIMVTVVVLYARLKAKFKSFLGEKELRLKDVILLVASMGIMVTVLVFIPSIAIMVGFLYVYCMVLFLFTYLMVPRYHLAILSPAIFVALYLLYKDSVWWNPFLLDLFAVVFSVFVSVYLGSLFSWKTTTLFVTLLTAMDVIQVFGTQFMVAASEKVIQLSLPVVIILPTFPSQAGQLALGLGDIFLAGLLSIQTTQRYGRKFGIAAMTSIAVVFMMLEMLLLNYHVPFFPATVLVIAGWLIALGARQLYKLYLGSHSLSAFYSV